MVRRFFVRLIINFLGLLAAATLLSGIDYKGSLGVLLVAALLFSIVNAFIRPIIVVLSLPAIVLTLGLFLLVINGLMLFLTSKLYPAFAVASFWQALLAVIIMAAVNYILTQLMEGAHESAV